MGRPIRKSLLVALTCGVFVFATGWPGDAGAAEWPTWPRSKSSAPESVPGSAPPATAPGAAEPGSDAAAKAGEEGGKKAAGGIKAGTIAKGALIAAGIVGIAIAIGGGSSSSNH